ncbi:ABC transporter ATP-binding protein [Agromyces sp. NPDC056965]|uniref:ABC transporter ATP-binding protein n=1 Tax=Agromyces sp. NPDC056965 TaxID=3345983 RepID=UPI0036436736
MNVAPAIQLEGVGRVHVTDSGDEVHALRDIDLTVAAGEYVVIVGPSGAGKSSLLNILGCLDAPTTGSLTIAGAPVSELSEGQIARIRNERIGFVFQSFNLIPALTARQNVELPAVYARVPRERRRRLAMAALDRVGLGDRAHHRPNQLSGGQQQRVAIARSIVNEPAFVLADEATGNLDSKATEDVLGIFDELHRLGTTIVAITHEDDVAARAERVVVVRDGRIAETYRNRERVLI